MVFLLILLLALIFLGYAYDDLSGWIAWSKAKKRLESEGFSLDPQAYLPPPVPDAENFGALPFFQLQPDPDRPQIRVPLVWDKTIHPFTNRVPVSPDDDWAPDIFPFLGRWDRNEKPDMEAVRRRLVELCRVASPPVAAPSKASATEIFSLLCPLMAELRKEDDGRPECRFNWNREPGSMDYGEGLTNLISLAKLLSYEGSLAICDQQPQLALDDLKVGWKVQAGLAKEPTLLSGLVGMGVTAIQIGTVQEGLYDHAWNAAQLAEIDADLGKIDVLAQGRSYLQGDFATYTLPLMLRYVADRSQMTADMYRNILQMKEIDRIATEAIKSTAAKNGAGTTKVQVDDVFTRNEEFTLWAAYWWPPNGDLYRYLADYARVVLPSAREALNPEVHRVYPEKIRSVQGDESWLTGALNGIPKFAALQVQIDEARIACRLERYWLAHQAYPTRLNELVPEYGHDIPHDVMTGEPYLYKREGDSYLLYSVAWNQKDEGGSRGKSFLTDSPDWVWPNRPREK